MPRAVVAYAAKKIGELAGSDPVRAIGDFFIGGSQLLSFDAAFHKSSGPEVPSFQQELLGNMLSVRQPISAWQWIYGQARVGGVVTFIEVSADNVYLHLVVTWAGHEVEELGDLYLGDVLVPLNGSGLATSGVYNKGSTANHVETFTVPWTLTGQVTVANAVASVNSVNMLLENGETQALTDVSPNTPASFFEYKRSGQDFTFSPNLFGSAAWIAGSSISIDYEETSVTSWIRVQDSKGDEASGTQPFPDLVSASAGIWTTNHKQTGRAKTYFRLEYSPDVFPTGIPNFSRVIKGRKVVDPRVGPTPAWSANAALCTADYIANSDVGLGADFDTEIDEDALTAAANICDEDVSVPGGGTENRYEMHGAFTCDVAPREILGRMLTALGGGRVRFIGGKYLIEAAAYATPEATPLTVDDLRGPLHIMPRISRQDLCNGVKGVYRSPDNDWQPTDAPPVQSSTYVTEDQGEEIWRELDLPFTKSAYQAQRTFSIELERTRQQITLEWPGKLTCYRLQPGNVVPVTVARLGYSAKPFEVMTSRLVVEESGEIGVDHVLRETAAAVYNAPSLVTVDPAPDTNLPSPFDIDPPSNLAFDVREWQLTAEGTLSWDEPSTPYVSAYEVQYKKKGAAEWTPVPLVPGDQVSKRLTGLRPGPYQFRAKSINQLGRKSAFSTTLNQTLTPPPVPRIRGLEIFNQGSNHVFTGRDCKLVARPVSTQTDYDIGGEPLNSDTMAGSGAAGQGDVDPFFKDYKWEFWDILASNYAETANQPVRTAFTKQPEYTYTWERNSEDHADVPARQMKVKLYGRDRFGNLSTRAAQMPFVNSLPAIDESTVTLTGVLGGFSYALTLPSDPDVLGVKVYASLTSGFTPGASTLKSNKRFRHGQGIADDVSGMPPGMTAYVKFVPYDPFGDGTTSSEFSVTADVVQDDGGLGAGDRDGIVTLKTSKAISTIFGASDYKYDKSAPPVWGPSVQHLLLNGVGVSSVYLAAINPRGLAVSKTVTLAAPFTFTDGSSQLVYLPSLDKVYMLLSDVLGVADPKIYEINPATLAITNTWTLTGRAADLLVMGCGSPRDGQLLLLAYGGRKIYTFDPSTGTLSSAFNLGASAGCYTAAYFPSFDKFAILSTVAADRSVYFVDRGLTAYTQYTPGGVITPLALAYSALGDRLWVYCDDQNLYLIKRDGTLDTTVASPSALYNGRLMSSKSSGLLAQYNDDGSGLPGDKVLTFSPLTKTVVSAGVSIGNGLVLFWSALCWIPPVDRAAAVYFDSGGLAAARLGSFTL